jgi:hypothetical protein
MLKQMKQGRRGGGGGGSLTSWYGKVAENFTRTFQRAFIWWKGQTPADEARAGLLADCVAGPSKEELPVLV